VNKIADLIEHWGLPKEQRFPLDTPSLVKFAAAAFEDQLSNMTPSQRLVCARNICKRASDLGVDVSALPVRKYAGSRLSPNFQAHLALRKEATAHLHDLELDKLLKVATIVDSKSDVNDRVSRLDKVAAALEDFDRRHEIDGLWGHWMPDPAFSTYGLPGSQEAVVKIAEHRVSSRDLESADWSRVQGHLPDEVVDGLRSAEDKLAVFDSLPDPEKEIIFQSLFLG